MGSPTGPATQIDSAWAAAESLVACLIGGRGLPVLRGRVVLDHDEQLHSELMAEGWRFHGLDVAVEQQRILAVGGIAMFGLAAMANGRANRRARVEAERFAAPQWRPLGLVPVLATNKRLLVLHEGAWASVWYSAIRQVIPALEQGRLELLFEDDPPYLLVGEWVPYLTVIITAVLADHYGVDAVASTLLTA